MPDGSNFDNGFAPDTTRPALTPDPGRAMKPVLIVVHQRHSCPGHVGQWFRNHGYPLDIRRVSLGDRLPRTLENHVGAVIFGGPQSANDIDEFIKIETDWIGVPLAEKKPFLGICLGAQMLARHLGAEVDFHPEACAEMGYYKVKPTREGSALMPWPERVYQWHREGFTLPDGATLLARGELFKNQAFRYGSAYGVQFHPEITHRLVSRWSTLSSHRLVLPCARPRREHIDGHVRYGPAQRRWLDAFLSRWVLADADRS